MKDRLLYSTINGISDSSKYRNLGRIIEFASPHAIPEVRIEEYIFKSFQEVWKHAKKLEKIVTLIEKFSLILANEKYFKEFLWTRIITHLMMS